VEEVTLFLKQLQKTQEADFGKVCSAHCTNTELLTPHTLPTTDNFWSSQSTSWPSSSHKTNHEPSRDSAGGSEVHYLLQVHRELLVSFFNPKPQYVFSSIVICFTKRHTEIINELPSAS